ncbi:MAG: hypothetical protein F4Z01_02235 [Gammaproteobacteria bacterium]|nr:hypothetical protein [Gammaproteobacteria bacterium]MYF37699.1 hypothetical protein [Gammaproteobacteria bacterium]
MKTNALAHPLQILIGVLLFVLACSASAEGMFYFGSGIGLENFKARYDKRADTDLFPTLSLNDLVFNDRDGGDGTPYSLNAFTGIRIGLHAKGLWFGIQTETVLRSDVIEGRLAGVGKTRDGYEISNLLEQNWTLRTDRDRSLVVRVGTVVSFLGMLDFSPYVVAGLREIEVAFERSIEICGTKLVCQPGEQSTTTTERRKPSLRQMVFGLGIEKFIGEKTSISLEARYNSEDDDSWEESTNDISTPSSLSTDSYDLALKFSVYL